MYNEPNESLLYHLKVGSDQIRRDCNILEHNFYPSFSYQPISSKSISKINKFSKVRTF